MRPTGSFVVDLSAIVLQFIVLPGILEQTRYTQQILDFSFQHRCVFIYRI